MTDFVRSTTHIPKSLLRVNTKPEIDIKNPKAGLEPNEKIKQSETSNDYR